MPMYDVRALNELVAKESAFVDKLLNEVGKVIVGQTYMIERILIGLLTGGHVLLEGVPGLAKTLTVRTLCDAIRAKFARIQFTPDLLPADLIGTVIYNQQKGEFTSKLGPIFANLVLADEINRAPAKVQSALLEAMQERQVTIGDKTYPLPAAVHRHGDAEPHRAGGDVPAARGAGRPLHADGEGRLPVARGGAEDHGPDDRRSSPPRPSRSSRRASCSRRAKVIQQIYVDDKVKDYIVDVVFATREPAKHGLKDLAPLIEFGASPARVASRSTWPRARTPSCATAATSPPRT